MITWYTKKCPFCHNSSYTANASIETWKCPFCWEDITDQSVFELTQAELEILDRAAHQHQTTA